GSRTWTVRAAHGSPVFAMKWLCGARAHGRQAAPSHRSCRCGRFPRRGSAHPPALGRARGDRHHEGDEADDEEPFGGLDEQAEQDEDDGDHADGDEQGSHGGGLLSRTRARSRVVPGLWRVQPRLFRAAMSLMDSHSERCPFTCDNACVEYVFTQDEGAPFWCPRVVVGIRACAWRPMAVVKSDRPGSFCCVRYLTRQ